MINNSNLMINVSLKVPILLVPLAKPILSMISTITITMIAARSSYHGN